MFFCKASVLLLSNNILGADKCAQKAVEHQDGCSNLIMSVRESVYYNIKQPSLIFENASGLCMCLRMSRKCDARTSTDDINIYQITNFYQGNMPQKFLSRRNLKDRRSHYIHFNDLFEPGTFVNLLTRQGRTKFLYFCRTMKLICVMRCTSQEDNDDGVLTPCYWDFGDDSRLFVTKTLL